MKLHKLTTTGLAHHIALMLVVVGAGIVGSAAVVASHAQVPPQDAEPNVWCKSASTAPAPPKLHHHHTDTVVLYNGGSATAYHVVFTEVQQLGNLHTPSDTNISKFTVPNIAPHQTLSYSTTPISTVGESLTTSLQYQDSGGATYHNTGSCAIHTNIAQ